jgi:hypothetical protein
MMKRSFPVPVWDNAADRWEAVDFQQGQRVVDWPADFDARQLPVPAYHEGDRVQFVRDETCAREGVVRLVLFQQETTRSLETRDTLDKPWYLDAEHILYIVTARGHDHRIREWNILGRFVSLERMSRVLPERD